MSNSSLNISNYITTIKDAVLSPIMKAVKTFTSGINTYTQIDSCTINVVNSSAKVLILVQFSTSKSGTDNGTGFKFQKDGVDLVLGDSASSRTLVNSNYTRNGNTHVSMTGFFLDTGVSSGAHTYSILMQTGGSITVGMNRSSGAESSSTARSLGTISALEL